MARTTRSTKAILNELRTLGSEENRAGMARVGIRTDHTFGVSIPHLRATAKRLGPDHDLALALWATGNHDARLLACFVDDPACVTEEQMEAWASEFDSWDLCDQATTSLFDRTAHAWAKATEWASRDQEWVRRGGFALMAGLAWHDKATPDGPFLKLLPFIERGAGDDRTFVKKGVSWALRNIGKRNRSLHAAAIACAERILVAATPEGKRGTEATSRAARWVASDVLRELRSEKLQARFEKNVPARAGKSQAKHTAPRAASGAKRPGPARRSDFGASVDTFFERHPAHLRTILERLRDMVAEAAPDAASSLKWGMPWFTVNGRRMCSLGGHKAHVNLILMGPASLYDDPDGLLSGSGTLGRHLKVTKLEALPQDAVRAWLWIAAEHARRT